MVTRDEVANFLTAERSISPVVACCLLVIAGVMAGSLNLVAPVERSDRMLAQAGGAFSSKAPKSCDEAIQKALGKQQDPTVTDVDTGQSGTVDACFGAMLKPGKKPSQKKEDYECVGRSGTVKITSQNTTAVTSPSKAAPPGTCSVSVNGKPPQQIKPPAQGGQQQGGGGGGGGGMPPMPSGGGGSGSGSGGGSPQPNAPQPNNGMCPDGFTMSVTGSCTSGKQEFPPPTELDDPFKNKQNIEDIAGGLDNPSPIDNSNQNADSNNSEATTPTDVSSLSPNQLSANENAGDGSNSGPRSEQNNISGETTFESNNPTSRDNDDDEDGKGLIQSDELSSSNKKALDPSVQKQSGEWIPQNEMESTNQQYIRSQQNEMESTNDAYVRRQQQNEMEDTNSANALEPSVQKQNGQWMQNEMESANDAYMAGKNAERTPDGAVNTNGTSQNDSVPESDLHKADSKDPEQQQCGSNWCSAVVKDEAAAKRYLEEGYTCSENENLGLYTCTKVGATQPLEIRKDVPPPTTTTTPPPPTTTTTPPPPTTTTPPPPSTTTTPPPSPPQTNPTPVGNGMCMISTNPVVVVPCSQAGRPQGASANPLMSFLNGFMKGLMSPQQSAMPQQPAQPCPADPQGFAMYQQQYNYQLQQYNYQLQQYNYQTQNSYSMYGGGYAYVQPPQPPQPCYPQSGGAGSGGACPVLAAQPDPAACPLGAWRQMTTTGVSGSVCPVWQCVPSNTITPAAKLTCEPKVAEQGTAVNITYACENAISSTGYGFITNGRLSGATSTVVNGPENAGAMNFALRCENRDLTASAQCTVQIAKITLLARATPKRIAAGQETLIGWVSSGMESCAVSNPDLPEFNAKNASYKHVNGVVNSGPLSQTTTFTVRCKTLAGTTKDATTTVDVYAPGTISADIEGKTIVHGSTARISWNFPSAPDVSAVSLWLVDVQAQQVVALITGQRAAQGTYAWSIPPADAKCDARSTIVCGSDLKPGRDYAIQAALYRPPNAGLGQYSDPTLPDPEYIESAFTTPFRVGGTGSNVSNQNQAESPLPN